MYKRLGIMLDTETFGLSAGSVCTEIAAVPFDLKNPSIKEIPQYVRGYLPVDPQLNMGRTIDAETLSFWLTEGLAARTKIAENISGDHERYEAELRRIFRTIKGWIYQADEVEIYCKGSDFDIPILSSLVASIDLKLPWKYDMVRDLRTIAKRAGVSSHDITPPKDFVKHSAYSDCKFQILLYAAVLEAEGE